MRTVGRWKVAKEEGFFVGYLMLIADAWTTGRMTLCRPFRPFRRGRGEVQNGIGRNGASARLPSSSSKAKADPTQLILSRSIL